VTRGLPHDTYVMGEHRLAPFRTAAHIPSTPVQAGLSSGQPIPARDRCWETTHWAERGVLWASDPAAPGARNDAIFTWLQQDIGHFLLPATVLVMLVAERVVVRLRAASWIGWTHWRCRCIDFRWVRW